MEPQFKKVDKNVWKKLPIHLLEHIVAFLPIPEQTRFRIVNKHFNNWISSYKLDTLSTEVPLKKHVVLWNSWQTGDFPYYSQIGGFGNLQRPSWIFNDYILRPFLTDLSMWFVDILAAKHCFMCIHCFAKDPRSSSPFLSNSKPNVVLLVLNLMNNTVRELPLYVLQLDDITIERVISVKHNIAVSENNDRDFRFVTVGRTLFNNITVMKLYDSATDQCMKFENLFPRLEYRDNIHNGQGSATFDRMFFLTMKNWTSVIHLTSLTYRDLLATNAEEIEIDLELPPCVMKGSFAEIELITTSSNRVFILGLSSVTLALWEVDLATNSFVECEQFRVVGEENLLLRFVGAYSDLLVFGPQVVDYIDPLIVRRDKMLDRMKDVHCVMDGKESMLHRMDNMLRACINKLPRPIASKKVPDLTSFCPLQCHTLANSMDEFKKCRGFEARRNDDSDDPRQKWRSIGEFRVYDVKRREWRGLTRIEVKSMSEWNSNFKDFHFELFYDPCVEFSNS